MKFLMNFVKEPDEAVALAHAAEFVSNSFGNIVCILELKFK